jgi:hypothetical protein
MEGDFVVVCPPPTTEKDVGVRESSEKLLREATVIASFLVFATTNGEVVGADDQSGGIIKDGASAHIVWSTVFKRRCLHLHSICSSWSRYRPGHIQS